MISLQDRWHLKVSSCLRKVPKVPTCVPAVLYIGCAGLAERVSQSNINSSDGRADDFPSREVSSCYCLAKTAHHLYCTRFTTSTDKRGYIQYIIVCPTVFRSIMSGWPASGRLCLRGFLLYPRIPACRTGRTATELQNGTTAGCTFQHGLDCTS